MAGSPLQRLSAAVATAAQGPSSTRPGPLDHQTERFEQGLIDGDGDADEKEGDEDLAEIALVKGDADTIADAGIGGDEFADDGPGHGQGGAAGNDRGQLAEVLEGADLHLQLPAHAPGGAVEVLDIVDGLGHDAEHREQHREIADHRRDEQPGEKAVAEEDEEDRRQRDDGIGLEVVGGDLDERAQPGGLPAGDADAERHEHRQDLADDRHRHGVQGSQAVVAVFGE